MAQIYQKPSADQCLVLGPRESLIYPFSLGAWSEIRVGAFFSYTSANDNNSTGQFEIIPANNGNGNLYWGLKDTGTNFPFQSNTFFVGMTNDTTITPRTVLYNLDASLVGFQSSYASAAQSDNTPNPSILIVSGATVVNKIATSVSNDYTIAMASGLAVSGSTAFAMFNGLRILYDRTLQVISGSSMQDKTYASATSDVSISNLQSKLASMPNLSTPVTGGGVLPSFVPNTIYFYNPFLQNQIRIHSLYVDKYA